MPKITPNLWFDTQGKDAAEFYVSVFPTPVSPRSRTTARPVRARPGRC